MHKELWYFIFHLNLGHLDNKNKKQRSHNQDTCAYALRTALATHIKIFGANKITRTVPMRIKNLSPWLHIAWGHDSRESSLLQQTCISVASLKSAIFLYWVKIASYFPVNRAPFFWERGAVYSLHLAPPTFWTRMEEAKPTSQFKVPSISIPRKKKPHQQEVLTETPSDPSRDVKSSQELTEQPNPAKDATAEEQSGVVEDQKDDDPSRQGDKTATSDKQAGNFPPVPYTVPHWSGAPTDSYFLSVIKNGIVIEEISLSGKPFLVFGRLLSCDVQLEHPSLSRYHAILQYRPPGENSDTEQSSKSALTGNTREPGYYVYDLGSTHGTYVNKSQINPRCYYRLRVGQMVKFGGSSRMFLLEVSVLIIHGRTSPLILFCVC